MQRRVTTAVAPVTAGRIVIRAISLTVLVLALLTWSQAANGTEPFSDGALAAKDDASSASQTTAVEETVSGSEPGAESVTMSIPLEEDGVIDVEAPHMDVKIEKWGGDDVLLIVEKKKSRARSGGESAADDPVTIQVTREGKNVRIETAAQSGRRERLPDVSFRIMLPEDDDTAVKMHEQSDTADRLTAAVWRAIRREALRWLTR